MAKVPVRFRPPKGTVTEWEIAPPSDQLLNTNCVPENVACGEVVDKV